MSVNDSKSLGGASIEHHLISSTEQLNNHHTYVIERLKYENLLKDQAIFKASKLIEELRDEACVLRETNQKLALINMNKTNEIKELERMLRKCYEDSSRDDEIKKLQLKLKDRESKIKKLQQQIKDLQRNQKQVEAKEEKRCRTVSVTKLDKAQMCKTEYDQNAQKDLNNLSPYKSAHTQSIDSRRYYGKGGRNTPSTRKKNRKIKDLEHQSTVDSEEIHVQLTKLRDMMQQKDDYILSLMKRNKALDEKYNSKSTNNCSMYVGSRYRNPREYHLSKVQSQGHPC